MLRFTNLETHEFGVVYILCMTDSTSPHFWGLGERGLWLKTTFYTAPISGFFRLGSGCLSSP